MDGLVQGFNRLRNRRFYRYGAPFMLLVVGASFGLKQFTQIRYTFTKKEVLTPDQVKELGIKRRQEISSLEDEYEKTADKIRDELDDWENIRGPRPWEDSKSVQELERELAKVKKPIVTS